MTRALFKKQFLELNSFYLKDRKTGKMRSKSGIIGFALLMAFVFISVGVMFFGIADMMTDALIPLGADWLYFAMMGMISIALGTFGSVFNTYAGLYHAKDNELLLSMPIPPSKILLVRMTSVYAMSLLYSALVWIPVIIQYWIKTTPSAASIVFSILLTFIIAGLVTVLTCALGWVVALISGKLKNKSFVTVFLTLVFLAVYYFVYFKLNSLLQSMIVNSDKIGNVVKTWIYPIYMMGNAAIGKVVPMLIFTAITAVLLALCVYIISRSFIRIVTTNHGSKKAVYKERTLKAADANSALLRKEFKRFLSSPTYMLNCGLGLIILIAAAVFVLVRMNWIRDTVLAVIKEIPPLSGMLPVLMTAAVCLMSSMNGITAPSISLEGKNIWILQSLPVEPLKVLKAKEKLHIILDAVPAVLCIVALGIAFEVDIITLALMILTVLVFIWFSAVIGLFTDLKKPNLVWTNETVPVKQSISVLIAIFGGWFIAIILGGGYFLLDMLPAWLYLILFCAVLAIAAGLIQLWLKRRGAERFARL